MKWICCLLFCLSGTLFSYAQTSNPPTEDGALYPKIVSQALRLRDYATATAAIHTIIAIQGPQSTWRDSLLSVYFQSGNYLSSQLLASELLPERPQDDRLLEISAVSLAQLGAYKEAIAAYEQLYPRSKKAEHAYELANLQYQIKRLAEAEGTLSQLMAAEPSSDLKVRYATPQGGSQLVHFKAAAYNLRGMVAFDLKQTQLAGSYFKKALELAPDFAIAQQNANAVLAQSKSNVPDLGKIPAKGSN